MSIKKLWDVQFYRGGKWQWLGVAPQGVPHKRAREMMLKFARGGAPEVKAESWRVRPVDDDPSEVESLRQQLEGMRARAENAERYAAELARALDEAMC